jgi:hypothetical protein
VKLSSANAGKLIVSSIVVLCATIGIVICIVTATRCCVLDAESAKKSRDAPKSSVDVNEVAALRNKILEYMSTVDSRDAVVIDITDKICQEFTVSHFRALEEGPDRFGHIVLPVGSRRGEAGDEIWSYNKSIWPFGSIEFTATANENTRTCTAFIRSVPLVP